MNRTIELRISPNGAAETRSEPGLTLETRDDGTSALVGYPIVFDRRSVKLWDFYEVIKPESVTETLVDSDIRALFDHDSAKVLGREKPGTMTLKPDTHGVRMELDLPDTTLGHDVAASVKRGDIDGMSFGFSVLPDGEHWHQEGDDLIRDITNMDLHHVAVVAWPAYPDTEVAVRSRDQWRHDEAAAAPRGRHPNVLRLKLDLDQGVASVDRRNDIR